MAESKKERDERIQAVKGFSSAVSHARNRYHRGPGARAHRPDRQRRELSTSRGASSGEKDRRATTLRLKPMCNDYEQHIAWAEYCRIMESLALQISSHQSELDLPQADIRINDPAPVMRAAGDAIELASMTFGFPPSGPNGGPVFNFRSEGRQFANSRRCLVPVSAFFEFTGTKYPKAKHRFTSTAPRSWRSRGSGAKRPATSRPPSPC